MVLKRVFKTICDNIHSLMSEPCNIFLTDRFLRGTNVGHCLFGWSHITAAGLTWCKIVCKISALRSASGLRLVTKQLWKQAVVFIIQKQHCCSCNPLAALILQEHVDVSAFKAFFCIQVIFQSYAGLWFDPEKKSFLNSTVSPYVSPKSKYIVKIWGRNWIYVCLNAWQK